MEVNELGFDLCGEDEQIVRTYACTRLRRLFFLTATGYLTITNKRIVFHSIEKSLTGKTVFINEMPLEDAASVSTYLGTSINWFLFAIFSVILFYATQFISKLLPPFLSSWVFAFLLMAPLLIFILLTQNILSEDLRKSIHQSINHLLRNSVETQALIDTYTPFARILFYLGLAIFCWTILFNTELGYQFSFFRWVLLAIAYFFIFIFLFGNYRTFSIMIGSKTMKGAGISIPGNSFQLIPGLNTSTFEVQNFSPAKDVEQVSRELGALLLDIRLLGDMGIQKWKQ